MKHFLLIANETEQSRLLLNSIESAIITRGGTAMVRFLSFDDDGEAVKVPERIEGIIAIGGDGTLIKAAQKTAAAGIPLLGVNRGHLGYLCDLDENMVYEALDALFDDQFKTEERMMLAGALSQPDGSVGKSFRALNDIVISRIGDLKVIQLTVYINGKYLYSFTGDGMIFATPTGSTAYNLSAAGPIVDPKTEVILMTPINPHSLNIRSIVLDPKDEISVEVVPRHPGQAEELTVSFDGSAAITLRPGRRIVVARAGKKIRFIRLTDMNFLERMRTKFAEG